tara:strand:- start:8937 stop:9326 length:390 start_codon:yes stop_codon:yes gene_type:complete
MQQSYFDGRVTVLHFKGVEDSRGVLVPVDFAALNFSPIRSFLVNCKHGARRGGHAHRTGTQLMLCVSGEIQVDFSLNSEEGSVVLGRDANALMLCAPVWSSQIYLGDSPSLIVFSDFSFNPSDYIITRD